MRLSLFGCLTLLVVQVRADEPLPLFSSPAESHSAEGHLATSAPPSQSVPPPAQPQGQGAIDLQLQKEQKFRELRRQMEILDQLVPGRVDEPRMNTEKVKTEDESKTVPEGAKPVPPAMGSETPLSDKPALPRNIPVTTAPAEPLSREATQMVVEGTIDRFSLATSLFATGQAETCLDVLKHTDLTSLSREEQIWAQYLQACCHRKCGRIDEAKQGYRRILAEKDADWIGQLSRWWLDNLDAKTQLQSDVLRLSETLSAWEEEIDTLAKQATRATALQ